MRASFMFVGDSNGHHQEWLGLQPQIVMMLQHLTSQLCLVAIIIIIIIIIIKRGWQCKAGRERLTPYQSEDLNPTTPTHRKKKEKGTTVGDKKGASS